MRNFLTSRFSKFLICAVAVAFICSSSFAVDNRPNILFCIADDWAWPHASAYGDKVVYTPNFDRVAREGILFTRAYSSAPSCTPSRAAILTGRPIHQLEEGANLHGFLPQKFETYPEVLQKAGYVVGYTGKGWGPGNFKAGGREQNPAGPHFASFAEFLKTVPKGKPFCFWFGSLNPHRTYAPGSGAKAGLKMENVKVPPYWPDTPDVRNDILDYYHEVGLFDRELGEVLSQLESSGRKMNTLVAVTGDNGWPFPRGKANLYDAGTHQPLAIRWPRVFSSETVVDAFVNLYDLAPTFLEAAKVAPRTDMTGKSLRHIAFGERENVFLERERHANVRKGDLSYPSRAVRSEGFLYIRNFRPDRWPAGDPEMWKAVGPFGDCDNSPTKNFILENRKGQEGEHFFDLCFGKRPAEELYDLKKDPYELHNLAEDSSFRHTIKMYRETLAKWMKQTADPRAINDDDTFDKYPYFGAAKKEGDKTDAQSEK